MCPEIQTIPQSEPDLSHELLGFRREMGTISRQSGVFFLGTIFTLAAGYLFKIYVARTLGAELLGVYALGMTVVGLLGVLAGLGLPGAACRFVAAYTGTGQFDRLRGFLVRSLILLLGLSASLGVLAVLGAHWISVRLYHTPALIRFMPLFGILLVASVLTTFGGQVLAGFKDVARRTVITNFVGTPLMMVLAVALLALGSGLSGYIGAQVVSAVVTVLLLARVVWTLTPAVARSLSAGVPHLDIEVIHFSAAIFGVGVLEFLLAQADKILLGMFLDARQVGIYATVVALVAFVPIILSTVNQIFTPVIAELHARGELGLIRRLYQTLTKWILGLTIPLGLVMMLFAPSFMHLFGRDFEAGAPVLVIGTLGQLVNCGVGSVGYLLLMSGNQRRLIKVQVVMAGATILLNLVFIPWLGVIGAALVGTVLNILTNLWCLAEVRQALGISPYNRGYLALVLPSAATAALLALLHYQAANRLPSVILILVALSAGYIVFAAGALLYGLDADDRLIVQATWARLRGVFGATAVSAL
jgi:O-antigen/teichoic acid export membrane protein